MNDTSDKPKAKVPPPPVRRGLIAAVPATADVPNNMQVPNAKLQDLNFKVNPALHRAFKLTAAMRGLAMKDLLEASFRAWQDQYGDEETRRLLPPTLD